jgi:hypothetical protein
MKVVETVPAVDKPKSRDAAELRDVAKTLKAIDNGTDNPFWFQTAALAIEALDEATDGRRWKRIAELHPAYSELDEASLKLIRSQIPSEATKSVTSVRATPQFRSAAPQASNANPTDTSANTKTVDATPNPTGNLDLDFRKGGFRSYASEDSVQKLIIDNVQATVAMDTVRNEYSRHSRIHLQLFDDDRGMLDVNVLNQWVYRELFSAPVDDPWVGLLTSDVYPALKNGGIVGTAKSK